MKILLVDDSSILRKFVGHVIADIDGIRIELVEAASGREALAAVEKHGSSIDLMLCDLGIPEIDGLSVLQKVKASPDYTDMTVVMITGDMSNETVSKALDAGATGFLVKPFRGEELTKLVRDVHSRSMQA